LLLARNFQVDRLDAAHPFLLPSALLLSRFVPEPFVMLRIVDRYVLLQFVQIFCICYVSLTGLFVVIDAFTNIDHFMTFARNENVGLAQVLAEYYSYRAIAIFDQTSGVLALIAAMFTITWIERYNELTALMAAGVSRLRVLRPVLVAAILLGIAAAANREVVMPQIREHLAVDSRNIGGDQAEDIVSRYDSQTDILIDGDQAIVATQTIIGPNFILPSRLAKYGKQIAAAEAKYVPADRKRPSGYLLTGVKSPTNLSEKPSLSVGDRLVIVTPHDADWLAADQLFVVSEVTFELLTGGAVWREFASTAELVAELRSPSVELGNDVRVAIHSRLLQPFLDGTLLFLGLPLIVSRSNRNPFVAIGMATVVVALFFAVSLGCQSLGNSGWIRPSLAAWLPLIIFCPVAVFLADSLRR
jgi:lipopolysaccharide export system permease protein